MFKPSLRSAACSALVAFFIGLGSPPAAAQTPRADSLKRDSVERQNGEPQTLEVVRVKAKRSSGYASGETRSATKLPALPRDIPQSLTTVTSALVRDQSMKGMADVVRYIPGVAMGQGEGNRDQPTIRGNSSTADFFVDGARDDAQYLRDLYNLERLEALKGSNAMVFGRGGGGGVLNRVTKEAGDITEREISAEAGSFGGRRITSDVQQRVSPFVSARLNSVYESSDLFRDHVTLDRSGINPTLTFTNGSRSTRLTAGYEYFRDRRTADRGIPSFQGKPVPTAPSTFFGSAADSYSRIDVNSANATLSHRVGGFEVRNRLSFANYDKFYQNIYPSGATAAEAVLSAYHNAIERQNLFNQTDVTLSRRTGRVLHDLLLGAELGRQTTDNFRETGYFGATATTARVPLSNPLYGGTVTFRQSATDADNGTRAGTSSLYLQDQITLADWIRVIAGARYERFDLRFTDNRTETRRDRDDEMISPRVGLVVKPAAPASLYASYSVSYLPGSGDQFGSLTDVTKLLRPERFRNYEVGAKLDALEGMSLTLAAYRLDRTNTRSTDPADPARVIQTGAQRSQGVELSASGNVTDAWQIAAGAARQKATIRSATSASPVGATVPLVPSTALSLWNKYSFTPRLGLAAGVVHQSKVFAAIDNTVTLPAFTRFDGAAYLGLFRYVRAQVNVENVFNVRYFPTSNGNHNIAPGSPREARLSITTTF